MTKNKLSDLNDHLFEQLERLNDDELSEEELDLEIKRSKAVANIARNIIDNADVVLQAEKFKSEALGRNADLPAMLENNNA